LFQQELVTTCSRNSVRHSWGPKLNFAAFRRTLTTACRPTGLLITVAFHAITSQYSCLYLARSNRTSLQMVQQRNASDDGISWSKTHWLV